jgi:parallel beta-helix repeat protein
MTKRQRVPLIFAAAFLAATGTILLVSLLSQPPSARADPGIRYVSATDPTCGGKSPCHGTVQEAVDAAVTGDEILVATGVYTGVQVRGGVTQVVYISQSVTIQGGYSADFSAWNLQAQPTTLDAEGQGRVVYVVGSGVTATLEGLRITGGDASEAGGGIHVRPQSGLALVNSEVYSNTSSDRGGGVYLWHSSYAALIGNRVYSNSAYRGGGIYLWETDDATVTGNDVYSNTALGESGICVAACDRALLADNRVFGNTAVETTMNAGGIEILRSESITLAGNDVHNNTAGRKGGGIYLLLSDAVLVNNLIVENHTPGQWSGDGGAGMYVDRSAVHLLHTTIARNSGADGSGVSVVFDSNVAMTNTILVSHTVGIQVDAVTVGSGSTATLVSTLWGADSWANDTDWINNGTLVTGTLNWWEEPGFVNPAVGDYHIGPGSGALDRGIEAGVGSDIDDEPRFYGPPDLGADEYWPPGALRRVYLPLVMR